MLGGDWASDMAVGASRNRERVAAGELRETEHANAQNLGQKYALISQLKTLDPDNPLLVDKSLVERIRKSALLAFSLAKSAHFNAAREAGSAFAIPERSNTKHSVKEAAENIAFLTVMTKELERLDPENPLLKDEMVKARLSNIAQLTFEVSKGNFEAVREAASGFTINPDAPAPKPVARMQPPQLQDVSYAERVNLAHAGAIAVRNALMQQLRMVDPENPLVQDTMLVERLSKQGQAAFKINGDDFDSARKVGDTFQVPGRDAVTSAPIQPSDNESNSQQVSTPSDNGPTVKSKRWFR
jgi:hypothetical protein